MSIVGKFSLGEKGLILDLAQYGTIVGRDNIANFLKGVGKELRRYDQWVAYQESLKNPKLFVDEGITDVNYRDFITNE